jgi:nitrite reductase/ring-hydroxylating ferredoxin subunit
MSPEDNERLTRVTGDAPMARLLRENYWMPFARSEALKHGDAPMRVRLVGIDLVAFRGADGSVGLMNEYCPHRRASLALGRVEGCSLRCIYHGWRMDAQGRVVEVPSEGERSDLFASRVKVERRIAREGGGLVWAWLGQSEPPPLPPLPFLDAPAESRWTARAVVKCNWLQNLEGTQDSVHLNWLHQGFHSSVVQTLTQAPRYEIEETAYGLRTAAIRASDDPSKVHLRVAEYIAPFYSFSPSRQPMIPGDNACFIMVPVDDETHLMFFCLWDEKGPLVGLETITYPGLDPDDLLKGDFTRENNWGQDRAAMAEGHFSGYTTSLLHEDLGVQMSMGAIPDRTKEVLCSTDLAVVRTRSFLLDLLDRQQAGDAIDGALAGYRADGHLPFSYAAGQEMDWREGGRRQARESRPDLILTRADAPASKRVVQRTP